MVHIGLCVAKPVFLHFQAFIIMQRACLRGEVVFLNDSLMGTYHSWGGGGGILKRQLDGHSPQLGGGGILIDDSLMGTYHSWVRVVCYFIGRSPLQFLHSNRSFKC